MKKIAVFAFAVLLVAALSVPASALENIFGGYWRTRLYHQENFNGEDDLRIDGSKADGDTDQVDTRTRIYYTAKFSDNFKFVNKFEFDAVWGTGPLGDIGADGKEFEIKNSYVDLTYDMMNYKIGIQGMQLARGLLFDDDFSGLVVTYKGDAVSLPLFWIKAVEGGTDRNTTDVDYIGINPSFNLNAFKINPFAMWVTSDNGEDFIQDKLNTLYGPAVSAAIDSIDDTDIYYLGVSLDATIYGLGLWSTFIYESGTIDFTDAGGDDDSVNVRAWVVAVGANMMLGALDVHGQFFYATGQDKDEEDVQTFFVPKGQSYYWSEIMGYGLFDNRASAGSPADQIGNIYAGNLGASLKPTEKLKVGLDVWWAQHPEEAADTGEQMLGTEIDLRATYQLMENLNLDLVGAYMFANNATSLDGNNKDDPWEMGTQLSLSF